MKNARAGYVQRVCFCLCLLLFLVILLLSSPPAIAQEPWDGPPFTADPAQLLRALQSIPVKGNPDAVGLLDEENVTFTADGRCRRTNRRLYWVRTTEGASGSSSVAVTWEPWHQRRPSLRARVITPDAAVHALDPATLEDTNLRDASSTIFSDRHLLRAPLPAMAAGSVTEFETILEDTAPRFSAGGTWRKYFSQTAPVRRTVLQIQYPASIALKFKVYSLPDLGLHKTESGGQTVITFEQGPLEARGEIEALAPEEASTPPRIDFSTGTSWTTVAAAYAKIIDDQLASADLKALVRRLTDGKETPSDIATALLQYVHQEVRYTGVEFGEAGLVPHTPKEVLKHKYGDCKDQAALLVALLREAGIPAYVALLATAPGPNVSPETPGMGHFDHAIVHVPVSPAFWIDVSAEFWRVGDLPEEDQGRLALVVAPQTTDLITTPEASPETNRVLEIREVLLAEFGPGKVTETTQLWGSSEAYFRMKFAGKSDPEVLKNDAREYAKQVYESDSVTGTNTPDPHDLTTRFTTRLEIDKVKLAVTSLDGAFVILGPVQITDRLPEIFWPEKSNDNGQSTEKKNNRKTELLLPMPYIHEIQYRIQAPPGFRPASVPSDSEKHFGACLLTERFTTNDQGIVTATIRFDTAKRRFTPTEVDQLKKGVWEFLRSDAPVVRFEQVGQADLEAGQIKEAFGQFRSLIKLHPQEELHHVQLANALLATGMGEAAREEAHVATKLEPNSALAHKTLGWILQHDLVGRRFRKGFDRGGAIAAYRTAISLDPDDAAIAIDLAILLEHDAKGVRYSAGSNLIDAVTVYNSVADKLDRYQARDNLLVAMLWAREFADLRQALKTVPSTPDRDALALACVAALQGSSAAILEAKLLGHDDQAGREALSRTAELLLRLRMYSEAVDLMTASARSSQDSAAVLARADVLRRTRRHEELEVKDSDPRSVAFRFLRTVIADDPAAVLDLYSRYTFKEEDKQAEREALRKELRSVQGQFDASEIPRDVVLDLTLSLRELNVQGDDQNGYTIRVQTTSDKPQVFFVTKEDGKYKLVATAGPEDPVGVNAAAGFIRELLHQGNISAARIWLDRLREQTALAGGEDPLSGLLLPRFWRKGKNNGDDSAVQYATAALMVGSGFSRDAVPILLDGRARATSAADAASFDIALAFAYLRNKQYAELLPVTERLIAAYPHSQLALSLHMSAFRGLERHQESQRFLEARLQESPDNADLLRHLAYTAIAQGRRKEATQYYLKIVAGGNATPGDFNNLAWNYLLMGEVSKAALDAAERSVLLTERKRGYVLHTLACLYAEVGRAMEARDLLLKDMEVEGMEEPDSNVWYGFGRIAEQYGLRETALAIYRRVAMPEEEVNLPDSTYTLAQRRIKALQASTVSR